MMATDQTNGQGASGGDQAQGEQADEQQGQGTFYLPADFPGSDTLKAGDSLTLKVVGKTDDGEIEVEPVPDEGAGEGAAPDDWKTDLDKTMAAKG